MAVSSFIRAVGMAERRKSIDKNGGKEWLSDAGIGGCGRGERDPENGFIS